MVAGPYGTMEWPMVSDWCSFWLWYNWVNGQVAYFFGWIPIAMFCGVVTTQYEFNASDVYERCMMGVKEEIIKNWLY